MPNVIQTAQAYVNKLIGQKFIAPDLISGVLELNNPLITFFNNGKQMNIPVMELSGLRNYDRNSGWKQGNMNFSYEVHDMLWDRGIKITIDEMDNKENFGLLVGNAIEKLNKEQIRPEVDALRFAKLAEKAGKKVSGTINPDKIFETVLDAQAYLENEEVFGDVYAFISYETLAALRRTPELQRQLTQENFTSPAGITFTITRFENLIFLPVPKRRFKTEVTLLDTEEGGFTNPETAKDINFMLVHPEAALAAIKHSTVRLKDADQQSQIDGYLLTTRLYSTIVVPNNKKTGIYLHHKA